MLICKPTQSDYDKVSSSLRDNNSDLCRQLAQAVKDLLDKYPSILQGQIQVRENLESFESFHIAPIPEGPKYSDLEPRVLLTFPIGKEGFLCGISH